MCEGKKARNGCTVFSLRLDLYNIIIVLRFNSVLVADMNEILELPSNFKYLGHTRDKELVDNFHDNFLKF